MQSVNNLIFLLLCKKNTHLVECVVHSAAFFSFDDLF